LNNIQNKIKINVLFLSKSTTRTMLLKFTLLGIFITQTIFSAKESYPPFDYKRVDYLGEHNIENPYQSLALTPVKYKKVKDLKPLIIYSKGKARVPIIIPPSNHKEIGVQV